MLDPGNDWPDANSKISLLDAGRVEGLEEWVTASPKRALTPDGRRLYVARRRLCSADSFYTLNLPPEPGQRSLSSLDFVEIGQAASHMTFHPGAEVLEVSASAEAVTLVMALDAELRDRVGVGDASLRLILPLRMLGLVGFSLRPTEDDKFQDLVAVLDAGGVKSATLTRLAEEREGAAQVAAQEKDEARADWARLWLESAADSGRYGAPASDQERFLALLEKHGLAQRAAKIRALALPCLSLRSVEGATDRVGASRLGGLPDLPRGSEWPRDSEGGLFPFLLQLNLAELPERPGLPLPREGLLSFFAGDCQSASDPGGGVRLYEAGDLVRASLPEGAEFVDDDHELLPGHRVELRSCLSLPCYGSDALESLDLEDEEQDSYFAACAELEGRAGGAALSYLGGHAYSVQEDLPLAASFQARGRSDTSLRFCAPSELRQKAAQDEEWRARLREWEWWGENRAALAREVHEWVTLLNLDSHSEADMSWWDAGRLNFLIHRDDLREERFDKAVIRLISS